MRSPSHAGLAPVMSGPAPAPAPVVNSHNEWDPLEEVVVGVLEGAAVPTLHFAYEATLPDGALPFFRGRGGGQFRDNEFAQAVRELEGFARLLEAEGVVVRRPDPIDHSRPFRTPTWQSETGLYSAMPRDLLIVVGNQIIEAPLAWRCRYFEIEAYRDLLKSYFLQGGQWTAAPRPTLHDAHYKEDYSIERGEWVTTEYEPTWSSAATSPTSSASSGSAATSARAIASTRSRSTTRTRCTSMPPWCRCGPAPC
jgi:glycine amidinotransferase